ncbi:MAG: hypothetical protein NVS3B21_08610 [Acidimicrobiales bacterium]
MVIEIRTFGQAAAASDEQFRRADERVQAEFYSLQVGFLRRTTARSSANGWIDIVLWHTDGDADRAGEAAATSESVSAFLATLDRIPAVQRYTTLD